MRHHFISYARSDGFASAKKIHDRLSGAGIHVWMDQERLPLGDAWDVDVEAALETSESLLYVLTPDSSNGKDRACRDELESMRKLERPLIPLVMVAGVRLPLQLRRRVGVDFTSGFETGITELMGKLGNWTGLDEQLGQLRDRLVDLETDLHAATDPLQQRRIRDRMRECAARIEELGAAVRDQKNLQHQAEQRIAEGQALERVPHAPVADRSKICVVGAAPWSGSDYFRNRTVETRQLDAWLRNDVVRLVAVTGRTGIGKTAMVCRLLQEYQDPDAGRCLPGLIGVIYGSTRQSRAITAATLLTDLIQVLPEAEANRLYLRLGQQYMPVLHKLDEVLEVLAERRVVVMVDAVEKLVHDRTGRIVDEELDGFLSALVERDGHRIKVIATSRVSLALVERYRRQRAEELSVPSVPQDAAEQMLRALDRDGTVGLRYAAAAELHQAWARTDGNPQALEAVYRNLHANQHLTLPDLLRGVAHLLPQETAEALIGKAFHRLDTIERMVIEALAVYGQPVSQSAVEYLLLPYSSGLDLGPTLSRLVNLQQVRRDLSRQGITRYGLSELDREYALEQVPRGSPADREQPGPPFTQYALLHRGAEYLMDARVPRRQRARREDVEAELMAFDLRRRGDEHHEALEVLLEVDDDLLKWGHAGEVLTAHAALSEHLTDREQRLINLDRLGAACRRLGDHQRATEYYEQGLQLVGDDDPENRLALLVNLGNTYYDLAELNKAADSFQDALGIAATTGRHDEPEARGGMCLCDIEMGRFTDARSQHEQALEIAREFGREALEAEQLSRGGYLCVQLGQWDEALQLFDDARLIADECQLSSVVVRSVEGRATVLLETSDERAIEEAEEAVELADRVGYPSLVRDTNYVLALAYLRFDHDIGAAMAAIKAAAAHAPPTHARSLPVLALHGVIALRAGDKRGARTVFGAARGLARRVRPSQDRNHALLDAEGLALAGLVLQGDRYLLKSAVEAYRSARSIAPEPSLKARARWLLDALDPDEDPLLDRVRAAASSRPSRSAGQRRATTRRRP